VILSDLTRGHKLTAGPAYLSPPRSERTHRSASPAAALGALGALFPGPGGPPEARRGPWSGGARQPAVARRSRWARSRCFRWGPEGGVRKNEVSPAARSLRLRSTWSTGGTCAVGGRQARTRAQENPHRRLSRRLTRRRRAQHVRRLARATARPPRGEPPHLACQPHLPRAREPPGRQSPRAGRTRKLAGRQRDLNALRGDRDQKASQISGSFTAAEPSETLSRREQRSPNPRPRCWCSSGAQEILEPLGGAALPANATAWVRGAGPLAGALRRQLPANG